MDGQGKNQRLVELLISKIKSDLSDKIDFVAAYGSYARGDDDKFSDLDLIIIEADGESCKFDLSFIIDDEIEIGYHLRSISWAEYESFIGTAHAGKIIQATKLYARNNDAYERYLHIKRLAEGYLTTPLDSDKIKRIKPLIDELRLINSDVQTAGTTSVKYYAVKLAIKAVEAVMELNCSYFRYSLAEYEKDIAMLTIMPNDFLSTYGEILDSADEKRIRVLANSITRGVVQIFEKLYAVYCPLEKLPINGAYEKLASQINSKYIRSQLTSDRKLGAIVGYILKNNVDELEKRSDLKSPVQDTDYFDNYKLPFAIKAVKEEILKNYSENGICVKKLNRTDNQT